MTSPDDEKTTSRVGLESTQGDTEAEELTIGVGATWYEFLVALERYCSRRGWILEFDSADDESCAIFGRFARQHAPQAPLAIRHSEIKYPWPR